MIIELHKNTPSEVLIREWAPEKGDSVTFSLFKDSSFQILAEGIAAAKLRDFQLNAIPVHLEINQEIDISKDQKIIEGTLPNILYSIFGLQLLHVSSDVSTLNGKKPCNWRSIIGNHVWSAIKKNQGVFSTGKFSYLISRHLYDVPALLQDKTAPHKFPSFAIFQKSIKPEIAKLRNVNAGTGNSEDKLIEWLFHAAENSYDHARFDDEDNGIPIEGYRGILIQKIKVETGIDISTRKDIPLIAKNYISARMDDHTLGREGIVMVMTAIDLGKGIQNTLPLLTSDETNFDRLNRAFEIGVTNKSTGMSEKAGYGLGEIEEASRILKALFYVVSGDIIGYYDFSDEPARMSSDQKFKLSSCESINKISGTSISAIWTYDPKNDDQMTLLD